MKHDTGSAAFAAGYRLAVKHLREAGDIALTQSVMERDDLKCALNEYLANSIKAVADSLDMALEKGLAA